MCPVLYDSDRFSLTTARSCSSSGNVGKQFVVTWVHIPQFALQLIASSFSVTKTFEQNWVKTRRKNFFREGLIKDFRFVVCWVDCLLVCRVDRLSFVGLTVCPLVLFSFMNRFAT